MRLLKYGRNLAIGWLAYSSPLVAYGACLGDQNAKIPLKVYIVPQLTATQIYTGWAPLLAQVGVRTTQCFEINVPSTIPEFESDLNDGKPDFAYMNPYHAVMKWRDHQYIPLIASSIPIFGVLSIRRDSKVSHVHELSGGKLAFPAPNAFAASLLIRATLSLAGVTYEPVYLKTHSNVYRAVIRGDVEAGGGIQSTLMSEPGELRAELRALMETKRYTAHPFSANARVPIVIQKQIQDAFLAIGETPEGQKLLKGAQLADPVVVTLKNNYKPLEELQLEKFVVRNAN